jgi:hypothetical protein
VARNPISLPASPVSGGADWYSWITKNIKIKHSRFEVGNFLTNTVI